MAFSMGTLYEITGSSGNYLQAGSKNGDDVTLAAIDNASDQDWTGSGSDDNAQLQSKSGYYLKGETLDSSATVSDSSPADHYLTFTDTGDGDDTIFIQSYKNDGTSVGYLTDENPKVMIRTGNNDSTQKWKYATAPKSHGA